MANVQRQIIGGAVKLIAFCLVAFAVLFFFAKPWSWVALVPLGGYVLSYFISLRRGDLSQDLSEEELKEVRATSAAYGRRQGIVGFWGVVLPLLMIILPRVKKNFPNWWFGDSQPPDWLFVLGCLWLAGGLWWSFRLKPPRPKHGNEGDASEHHRALGG